MSILINEILFGTYFKFYKREYTYIHIHIYITNIYKHEIHVSLFHNLSSSCVQADQNCKAHCDETQDPNILGFYKPNHRLLSSRTCHKVMFNNICTNYTWARMHVGNLTAGILKTNDKLVVNVDKIPLRRRQTYCTELMNNNTFGIVDIGYRIVDIVYRIVDIACRLQTSAIGL